MRAYKVIESAEEFVALRDSELKKEYDRSAHEEASLTTWVDVIDRYPEYAVWVAHNKTVPLEILERLCDFDVKTRAAVASKRKLTGPLFERLSKDDSGLVRCAVAANRKAPIRILTCLMFDEEESVSSVAKYNLNNRKK